MAMNVIALLYFRNHKACLSLQNFWLALTVVLFPNTSPLWTWRPTIPAPELPLLMKPLCRVVSCQLFPKNMRLKSLFLGGFLFHTLWTYSQYRATHLWMVLDFSARAVLQVWVVLSHPSWDLDQAAPPVYFCCFVWWKNDEFAVTNQLLQTFTERCSVWLVRWSHFYFPESLKS